MNDQTASLAGVLAAIANDDRLAILRALRESAERAMPAMTVTQIAAATSLSRFSASRHLRLLSEAGLVAVARRGASLLHVLRSEGFEEIEDWLYPFIDVEIAGAMPAAETA